MCPLQGDLLSVTFDPETADATFDRHYVATIKVATSLVCCFGKCVTQSIVDYLNVFIDFYQI